MLKKSRGILLVCLILLFTNVAQPVAVNAQTANAASTESVEYLKSVMDMIKQKYNGQVSDSQLIEGALKGMLDTMDPYTTYWTNEEAESFFSEMEGSYEGIGITMEKDGDYIKVAGVIPGSPAEKAGLLLNDRIIEVDSKDIKGLNTTQISGMIKGKAGTSVVLGIIRESDKSITKITIERGVVVLDPGTYSISNGIGYIKLDLFGSNSANFMNRTLEEMDKQGVTKLILDLRDNPGGEVVQAVQIAQNFVPRGLITKLDFKDEDKPDIEYLSELEKPKYKLVVLVNENSASASEVLAGAIQDTKAGTLVGVKTFGKAKVQDIFPLLTPEAYERYGNQLGVKLVDAYDLYAHEITPLMVDVIGWTKITTGLYYTPNGRMIDQQGLVPDVVVKNLELGESVDMNNLKRLSSSAGDITKPSADDIYSGETIISLLGYKITKVDTIMDDETAAALKVFQKDAGLEETGAFDDATRVTLNKKLAMIFNLLDRQYTKAVEILNQ